MKQLVWFEMNVPRNSEAEPEIDKEGNYIMVWKMPNGSQIRLTLEGKDVAHDMYAKIIGLERHRELAGG